VKSRLIAAAFCLAILTVGCSGQGNGTVTGAVLVDGQPHGGFDVEFVSVKDGSSALGASQKDGTYELFRGRGEKLIPAGEYKVTINPTGFVEGVPMPKVKLPPTYTDANQTVIIKTIQPGENKIDVELNTAS